MFLKSALSFVFCIFLVAFGLTEKLQKKVDKVVKSTFAIETFSMQPKDFSEAIVKALPSDFSKDHFFQIQKDNELLGYAYVAKAPSKTDEFDYLILFDPELIIITSKVLVYREDYGGEIGSKRWLKQFNGKTASDELIYGDNIVAISGATISVRSMTNAVNNVLKSIRILQDKNEL
jgi:Na+-translocating ferredoxin:NAD+ oxidoreductase RnfG subunit